MEMQRSEQSSDSSYSASTPKERRGQLQEAMKSILAGELSIPVNLVNELLYISTPIKDRPESLPTDDIDLDAFDGTLLDLVLLICARSEIGDWHAVSEQSALMHVEKEQGRVHRDEMLALSSTCILLRAAVIKEQYCYFLTLGDHQWFLPANVPAAGTSAAIPGTYRLDVSLEFLAIVCHMSANTSPTSRPVLIDLSQELCAKLFETIQHPPVPQNASNSMVDRCGPFWAMCIDAFNHKVASFPSSFVDTFPPIHQSLDFARHSLFFLHLVSNHHEFTTFPIIDYPTADLPCDSTFQSDNLVAIYRNQRKTRITTACPVQLSLDSPCVAFGFGGFAQQSLLSYHERQAEMSRSIQYGF